MRGQPPPPNKRSVLPPAVTPLPSSIHLEEVAKGLLCLVGREPCCQSDYRNNSHRTLNPHLLKTQQLAKLGPVALPDTNEEMTFPSRALSTEGSSP